MLQQLAHGWKLVSTNKRMLMLVSLYQLIWTILLFILTQHFVSPILRALPNSDTGAQASQYFWLEARFLVAKTDVILPYLYLLIALLLIRTLIAPLIQSGLYGMLAKSKLEQTHNKFLGQLKLNWKSFFILHWIKTIAIIIPVIVLLSPVIKTFTANYFSLSLQHLPWISIALLIIWCILISGIIYGLLIGLVNNISWQQSLNILLKRAFKLIGAALIITLMTCLICGILQFTTLYMFGIISTLIFFILPIIRTFLKAWVLSTHIVQFEQ